MSLKYSLQHNSLDTHTRPRIPVYEETTNFCENIIKKASESYLILIVIPGTHLVIYKTFFFITKLIYSLLDLLQLLLCASYQIPKNYIHAHIYVQQTKSNKEN